jgi:hypothetical protein
MKLKKISKEAIESGNVMGPLLVLVFVIAVVIAFLFLIPFHAIKVMFFTILVIASFLYVWFWLIPNVWNYFVGNEP